MGRRGPPPKPTNLRILHGEEERRINRDEPQPDGPATPPDYMSAESRLIWDELAPGLIRVGLLTAWDAHQFAAYCETVVKYERAAVLVNDSGMLVKGRRDGIVRNPAMQIYREMATLMRVYAQEFGLTPSARVQIRLGRETRSHGGAERLLS